MSAPKTKRVPLPETAVRVPAWSAGGGETTIEATKRCLVTEEPTSKVTTGKLFGGEVLEVKHYTTDDCPVYELEKCAAPVHDPGLQAAGIEVCAVVKVDEHPGAEQPRTPKPSIQNRITFRPAGCTVVKGFKTPESHQLLTPAGVHAPEGVVECTHTAAYVGPLEGIASVEDVDLALRVGTEEALPKEIRYDPYVHFGALWSYVEGILQEGVANVFQGAQGEGETPAGFNAAMQKQVYRAAEAVAPQWARSVLLPAVLEAWAGAPPEAFTKGRMEVLEETFHLVAAARADPAILALVRATFPAAARATLPAAARARAAMDRADADREFVGDHLPAEATVSLTGGAGGWGHDCGRDWEISVHVPRGELLDAINRLTGTEEEFDLWPFIEGTPLETQFEAIAREVGFDLAADYHTQTGDSTEQGDFIDFAYRDRRETFEEWAEANLSPEKIDLAEQLAATPHWDRAAGGSTEIPECLLPADWEEWANAHLGTTF